MSSIASSASATFLSDLLPAGWTDANRLMAFNSPIKGVEFVPETAHIIESLSPNETHPNVVGYRIEMTALCLDDGIDLDNLIGQRVGLRVMTQQGRSAYFGHGRPFYGFITDSAHLGSNGGLTRYRFIIEPWLAFLRYEVEHFLFQGSVLEILDEIFQRMRNQYGLTLSPKWRYALHDAKQFFKRSLEVQGSTQGGESLLAVVWRLIAEEGLFAWFEHHEADDSGATHTLVIGDDIHQFTAGPQAEIRYTQASAVSKADSIIQWQAHSRVVPSQVLRHSYSYGENRIDEPSTQVEEIIEPEWPELIDADIGGQYAWHVPQEGKRLAQQHAQNIVSRAHTFEVDSTVRTLAPALRFTLQDHATANGEYYVVSITHQARNNFSESFGKALAEHLPLPAFNIDDDNEMPEFYQNHFIAHPTSINWRSRYHEHGLRLRNVARSVGVSNAVVIGATDIYTDRDNRIKVQYPWQRGSAGAAGNHPSSADNASGNPNAAQWLRVVQNLTGANFGSSWIPRVGQEVMTVALEGNPNRRIVLGAVYDGQGKDNTQGNQIRSGDMNTTGNGPSWFGGKEDDAKPTVFSGFKTQELPSSQSGDGGYNQLVFDDTNEEGRITFETTQYNTRLSLGHLKAQDDNPRGSTLGHGFELATQACGAIRGGSGVLLSTHGSHPDSAQGAFDAQDAVTQLQASADVNDMLSENATKNDPQAKQAPEVKPILNQLAESIEQQQSGASSQYGGSGSAVTWSEPHLIATAPAGIVTLTPGNAIFSAGKITTLTAQNINLAARNNLSFIARSGINIYTAGESSPPFQGEGQGGDGSGTGIHLHAVQGKVEAQAQQGAMTLLAHKKISFVSEASLKINSQEDLLLTAGGAFVKLTGANIECGGTSPVIFHGQHQMMGPKPGGDSVTSMPVAGLEDCAANLEESAQQGGLLEIDN